MILNILIPIVIIINYSKATSSVLKVVVNVANKDLDLRKVTIVAWRNDNGVVNDFLKNFNGSVITVDLTGGQVNKRCEQYVFLAAAAKEYDYLWTILNEDQIRPVRVILVLLEPSINSEDLRRITKSSWNMDITDLVIIYKEEEDVKIATYFPKTKDSCENYDPMTFNATEVTTYFPRKFKNFFGCPLRVSFLDWPPYVIPRWYNGTIVSVAGTEGRLVQILVQMLNASMTAVFPKDSGDFGVLSSYGRWTGIIGDLMYGRADISATSAITNLDRFQAVQLTHSYKISSIVWCAPNQVEIRAWAKVFLPLFKNVTVLLVISSISFVIAYVCIQKYQMPQRESNKPTLFYSWAIFLGQFVKFETVSWLLNSLFILWVWVCLVLRIAFQGQLVKDLEKVILEPHFKTFAEAHKHIDNYGGSGSLATFYKDFPEAENFEHLSLTELRLKIESISRGERFLLAVDFWILQQFGVKVQILDEPVVRSPVSIFIRRQWAASTEFDAAILRIVESGIYDKISEDYVTQYILKNYKKYTTHDLHFISLDWLHLSGCFYGLLIECIFCCFLLCLENVWYEWNQRSMIIQYNE